MPDAETACHINAFVISIIDHISDASDRSLFCLPVQTHGAYAFKLALCLISRGLEGVDVRIVNTLYTMR